MNLQTQRLFDSFYKIDRHRFIHPTLGEEMEREVFAKGKAACVLLYDPNQDLVLLVEEFRIGNLANGYEGKDLLSIGPVAGMIKDDQSPFEGALIEVREEAGITLSHNQIYGPLTTLVSPGCSKEIIYHYLAVVDIPSHLDGQTHGLAEEGEQTRIKIIPRSKLNAAWFCDQNIPQNGLLVTCMFLLNEYISKNLINPT